MHQSGGEISAQVIALVTAYRGGMTDVEISQMMSDSVLEVAGSAEHVAQVLTQMLGELLVVASTACDGWDAAAGGNPSGRLLAAMGQIAAENRAGGAV